MSVIPYNLFNAIGMQIAMGSTVIVTAFNCISIIIKLDVCDIAFLCKASPPKALIVTVLK